MCTEREVSICAKDSGGPYNYEIVSHLVQLAKENNIGFAVDVYPHYGSDVETTLRAGNDIRHALIGPGVYASHGYERSHRDGADYPFPMNQAYIYDDDKYMGGRDFLWKNGWSYWLQPVS